ncbi:hypothetical protein E0504_06790 [Parafrankia sp. BMG5.11]|nr:hypothetical protein E0504_06790 [Parafrankia sp. BMG5.11]
MSPPSSRTTASRPPGPPGLPASRRTPGSLRRPPRTSGPRANSSPPPGDRRRINRICVQQCGNTVEGRVRHRLSAHDGRAESLAFSPDGRHLVTGGDDHKVRIWDVERGSRTEAHTPDEHHRKVTHVAYHPDGRRVASTSHDGKVRIWNVETGRCLRGSCATTRPTRPPWRTARPGSTWQPAPTVASTTRAGSRPWPCRRTADVWPPATSKGS